MVASIRAATSPPRGSPRMKRFIQSISESGLTPPPTDIQKYLITPVVRRCAGVRSKDSAGGGSVGVGEPRVPSLWGLLSMR